MQGESPALRRKEKPQDDKSPSTRDWHDRALSELFVANAMAIDEEVRFGTPQEVAAFYAEVRNENYGRVRRLSPRHSMLAAFYAGEPDEATPVELLRGWNARCDKMQWPAEWKYTKDEIVNFHRDAKTAFNRLAELGGKKNRLPSQLPATIKVTTAPKAARKK